MQATPSQRFLFAILQATIEIPFDPRVSEEEELFFNANYSRCLFLFDTGHVNTVFGVSDENTVELESLIAYPEKIGNGTATMRAICGLADAFGVTLWLGAKPFGANRSPIPVPKLQKFHSGFGFFPVKRLQPRWMNSFHKHDGCGHDGSQIKNLMLRNPKSDELAFPSATTTIRSVGLNVDTTSPA